MRHNASLHCNGASTSAKALDLLLFLQDIELGEIDTEDSEDDSEDDDDSLSDLIAAAEDAKEEVRIMSGCRHD